MAGLSKRPTWCSATLPAPADVMSRGMPRVMSRLCPRGNGSLEEAQRQFAQFIYEREVTEVCTERRMRRVIRGLATSTLKTPPPFALTLHYLIFEWAERDVRSYLDPDERHHLAVLLRWLHHTVTAIQELHYSEIVHQDIQPANVVVMPNLSAKLGGLGHAFRHSKPRDTDGRERDPTYTAPERLYAEPIRILEDRLAADLYAFGGIVLFLICGVSLNAQVSRALDPMHHWSQWRGSFTDVLPYLVTAFDEVLQEAVLPLDPMIRKRLEPALRQLCDPNPKSRGHPDNRGGAGSRYGLERYVSTFDVLATHAEWQARKARA